MIETDKCTIESFAYYHINIDTIQILDTHMTRVSREPSNRISRAANIEPIEPAFMCNCHID